MYPGDGGLLPHSYQESISGGPCLVAKKKITAVGRVLLLSKCQTRESEFSCGPSGYMKDSSSTLPGRTEESPKEMSEGHHLMPLQAEGEESV